MDSPDDKPSARSDLLGGAGWALFGLLIVGESLRMDRFTSMGGTLYTMPGLVPAIFGGLLLLLGAALAWRGWQRIRVTDSAPRPLLNRRIALTLATTLVYALGLVGRAPFGISTALFVAVFVYLFTPADITPTRRAVMAGLVGVITSTVVVLVFERVFLVRLP